MSKLWVVATPIGNLEDLTPRARDALRTADVVLAEDTRHTRPLLDRVGSQARLVSCHAHNERDRGPEVVELLEANQKVCLVTDAGSPGVSDPGARVVEAVVEAGLEVVVLPGPSAVPAALMGAGLDVARFSFLGFLPRSGRERETLVESALRTGFGLVIYEATNRLEDTLTDLARICGPRRVVVARELTKIHETFHRGVLGSALQPPLVEKGEAVVIVEAGEPRTEKRAQVDLVGLAHDESLTPKERARRLAAAEGISVREAYARLQASASSSGKGEVERALRLLGQAAEALLHADELARAARQETPLSVPDVGPSEIPGADALARLLAQKSAIPAPVEVKEAAEALLRGLEALDALRDALGDD